VVEITHYTSPNYTDQPQVNIHWIQRIENFFIVQDVSAICGCTEKQSCPGIFHSVEYIFRHSGFLSNFALVLKTELPWNFSLYWIYLYIQDFWATCACPENRVALKIEWPWKFSLHWIYFWHSGFLSNFVLALKNRVCPEFTVLKYFLSFRIFEQLALAPKTEFALTIFTVLDILFTSVFFKVFKKCVVVELKGVITTFPYMSGTLNWFSQKRKFPSKYA